LMNILKQDEKL